MCSNSYYYRFEVLHAEKFNEYLGKKNKDHNMETKTYYQRILPIIR